MIDLIRFIGSIFYPFVEGIRIIGILIGISVLSTTEVGVENPRFYETSKGNFEFSFSLKNAFNSKFKKLVEKGIPSGFIVGVSFSVSRVSFNWWITNKVIYDISKNKFVVYFQNNNKISTVSVNSIDEAEKLLAHFIISLPRDELLGEEVLVNINAEPFFEYYEFKDLDQSRAVWGRRLNITLKYRL
ncbi:MAG: hypothetical protein N2712_04880 [Brevinematales bacterium]|nr:hypothetical protein [Brevinematales bacterium]